MLLVLNEIKRSLKRCLIIYLNERGVCEKNSLLKFGVKEYILIYIIVFIELKGMKLKSVLIYYCDFVMIEYIICF